MNKTGLQEHFLSELSEWQLMKDRGLTTFVEVPLEWGEENSGRNAIRGAALPIIISFVRFVAFNLRRLATEK
jgi:hypothetical protein